MRSTLLLPILTIFILYNECKAQQTIDACSHGNNFIDIILLVDASCPLTVEQCEQQQQFIADTMTSVRGIDTINIDNSTTSQVRIGYITFDGKGSQSTVLIDITDTEVARDEKYDIINNAEICNNLNQRKRNPNLLNGLNAAYDSFDNIDDGSIENSVSDKFLVIFSNCGVKKTKDITSINDTYTDRYRADTTILMVNNYAISDHMPNPSTYLECLVDNNLNRIFVVDDGYNYTQTISQLQMNICENIPGISTTEPILYSSTSEPSIIPSTTLQTTQSTSYTSTSTTESTTYSSTAEPSSDDETTSTLFTTEQTTALSTTSQPSINQTINQSIVSKYTTDTSSISTSILLSESTTQSTTPTILTTESSTSSSETMYLTNTSTDCDVKWSIAFEMKMLEYNQTRSNWKHNLELALLNAFKQTIKSTVEWNTDWCVAIDNLQIELYEKITRRVLLQNDTVIIVTGVFTFNYALKDAYFDYYNATKFAIDYKRILLDEIQQNESDIYALELEGMSKILSSAYVPHWSIYLLWIAVVVFSITCIVVLIAAWYKPINDTYSIESDDETSTEEFTDDEQQSLVNL